MSFNISKCPPDIFLRLRNRMPVIDVRSPGEYARGHIPGAVNIPLFNDSQRAEVGTLYTKKGSTSAVLRGIDLAAPEMSAKLIRALDLAPEKQLLVYCWRGGMRSEAMAWLFSTGGLVPMLLDGGYKAYRNYILTELGKKRNFIILGGLTGSGKTDILKHMISLGEQVTDLEGLACHRGSAFGAMGQPPQPSSEHFANILYDDLNGKSDNTRTWIEDESHNIGMVFMPDCFWNEMQSAPVIALMMDVETRLPGLVKEYTAFPVDQIIESVRKVSKRLGREKTNDVLEALKRGDYPAAIKTILEYYDKSYKYGLSQKPPELITFVKTDTDDVAVNALRIIEAAQNIL